MRHSKGATIQLLSGARAARLFGATSAQWDDLVDEWSCRGGRWMGGIIVRWAECSRAERGVDSAATEKAMVDHPQPRANTARAAATHKWSCSLNKKSKYRCCRGLVTPSRRSCDSRNFEFKRNCRSWARNSESSLPRVTPCNPV